jgi:hypothetical protein
LFAPGAILRPEHLRKQEPQKTPQSLCKIRLLIFFILIVFSRWMWCGTFWRVDRQFHRIAMGVTRRL